MDIHPYARLMHPTAKHIRDILCSGTSNPCGLPMGRVWRYMGHEVIEVVSCACDCDQSFMGTSPAPNRSNDVQQAVAS